MQKKHSDCNLDLEEFVQIIDEMQKKKLKVEKERLNKLRAEVAVRRWESKMLSLETVELTLFETLLRRLKSQDDRLDFGRPEVLKELKEMVERLLKELKDQIENWRMKNILEKQYEEVMKSAAELRSAQEETNFYATEWYKKKINEMNKENDELERAQAQEQEQEK